MRGRKKLKRVRIVLELTQPMESLRVRFSKMRRYIVARRLKRTGPVQIAGYAGPTDLANQTRRPKPASIKPKSNRLQGVS
jgi:hypothetical protein